MFKEIAIIWRSSLKVCLAMNDDRVPCLTVSALQLKHWYLVKLVWSFGGVRSFTDLLLPWLSSPINILGPPADFISLRKPPDGYQSRKSNKSSNDTDRSFSHHDSDAKLGSLHHPRIRQLSWRNVSLPQAQSSQDMSQVGMLLPRWLTVISSLPWVWEYNSFPSPGW